MTSRDSLTIAGLQSTRLAAYLASGVGSSLLATSDAQAAIVAIDLTNVQGNDITGENAGLAAGAQVSISNWLGVAGGGTIRVANGSTSYVLTGLSGSGSTGDLFFAWTGAGSKASPKNFGAGALIGVSSSFAGDPAPTNFYYKYYSNSYTSPDLGPNSFMGFRFRSGSDWSYGYLEVTWDSASRKFELLSGAYNDTPNEAILAGATPVPEPSGGALAGGAMAALVMGGAAARRWKKAQRQSITAA